MLYPIVRSVDYLHIAGRYTYGSQARFEDDPLAFVARDKGNKTGAKAGLSFHQQGIQRSAQWIAAIGQCGLVGLNAEAIVTHRAQQQPFTQLAASWVVQVADPG